jgi:serine/threonine protein kinase
MHSTQGFAEDAVCNIFKQAAEGLAYLHSKQWLHRDIRASNLLICTGGVVKLSLGGATCLTLSDTNSNLVGAVTHMAPELLWGNDFTDKCDVWSLGVTVLELLQGVAPYKNITPATKIAQLIVSTDESPDNNPLLLGLSQQFGIIARSCLYKDASMRSTAANIIAAFASQPQCGVADLSTLVPVPARALPYDANTLPPFVHPVPVSVIFVFVFFWLIHRYTGPR